MAIDKNNHLREVLDTHKMHHVQDFVNKVKNRREEIKVKMHNHFGNSKYSSFGSGSFAKHTAINVKFDFDLVEPFKHSAFNTLQEMFDSVYDFLAEEYKNTGVTIRKQKVSIGVSFPMKIIGGLRRVPVRKQTFRSRFRILQVKLASVRLLGC